MPQDDGTLAHASALGVHGSSGACFDQELLSDSYQVLVFAHLFSHSPATIL